MICIARTLGAPVTVPAGKQARSTSNGVTPSRSSPTTSDTRCETCEKRSISSDRATRTVPARHTRERSLRPRSTSITCSARSFSDARSRSTSPSPAAVVPAMGETFARPSSQATSRSGDEPTRASSSSSSRKRYGDGLTRRSARYSSSGSAGVLRVALRRHDLEGVALLDVRLAPAHHLLVPGLRREALERARRRRRRARGDLERTLEPRRDVCGIPDQHLGDTRTVVEADERLDHDEATLRQSGSVGGQRHRRLERRGVVVGEVADDRGAERLRFLERDHARAPADERVAPEPPALDRLEQEAAPALTTQPEVCPERGDEVSGYRR